MPELPEVETIKRDLEREIVGKRIRQVDVTGMRSIRRHPNKKHFISKLEGHKISGVRRRGKYLVISLDSPDILVVHLGMSGQLLRTKGTKDPLNKHTHVVITFTQGVPSASSTREPSASCSSPRPTSSRITCPSSPTWGSTRSTT